MRRRQYALVWVFVLFLSLLFLGGVWLYTNWASDQTVLPSGMTINRIPVGGMTRQQALNTIAQAYTVPITVYYGDEQIPPLLPEMVELSVDMQTTAANLDRILDQRSSTLRFFDYILDLILGRQPQTYTVNAVVNYSRDRVDAFLLRTAQRYDRLPQQPVPLPEAGTFRPASEGTTLDIMASLPLVVEAILAADPALREVRLVVDVEPAPDMAIGILEQALEIALAEFGGIAGIFAKDLGGGQELCINCNIAFSGLNTTQVAIALHLSRDGAPAATQLDLLQAMLDHGDSAAADQLLAEIGAGNPYSGALQVTDFLWGIGLNSTYLAAPFENREGIPLPDFTTPAQARPGPNTNPDAFSQTTPREMGLLFEAIYQCSRSGGVLHLLHPEIQPDECQFLLDRLARADERDLLRRGVPPGTPMASRHSWIGDTHSEIAVIYGPQRIFVLSVFLQQPQWQTWEEGTATFVRIAELTYRFFNGDF